MLTCLYGKHKLIEQVGAILYKNYSLTYKLCITLINKPSTIILI